jgi:hypothetical protein
MPRRALPAKYKPSKAKVRTLRKYEGKSEAEIKAQIEREIHAIPIRPDPAWWKRLRNVRETLLREILGEPDPDPRRARQDKLPKAAEKFISALEAENAWREFAKGNPTYLRRQFPVPFGRQRAVREKIQKIAARTGANPQDIERILFSRGNLDYAVGDLLRRELTAHRRASAAEAIYNLLQGHGWPWSSGRFQKSGVLRTVAAEHARLDKVLKERRDKDINKSPRSKSFHTVAAVAVIGCQIAQHLTPFMFTEAERKFRTGVALRNTDEWRKASPDYVNEQAWRDASELLRVAFPTATENLTTARLKARRPKNKGRNA